MPKIVDYEKKRYEITQKAIDVFIRDGYYPTNLSDIAKECGMGRTTLYQYFKNKREIFHYSVRYAFNQIISDCKNVLNNPNLSFMDKIKGLFSVLASYSKNNKNILLIIGELNLILQRNDFHEMVEDQKLFANKVVDKFKLLLIDGIKSKEIKDMDVDSMSYTLYTMVKSLFFHPTIPHNIDVDEHLHSVNLLIDGLRS